MSFNEVERVTANLNQIAGSFEDIIYADAPVGAIIPYGGSTAPTGWLICNGAAVSRTTYSDLFAVIGTKYGAGDGSTTFNLPDAEAGAVLYPAAEIGSGIAGSVYIIKAVKTALPTDFQTALEEKQDIADDALETTSKEIVGAINEINGSLQRKSSEVVTYNTAIITQASSSATITSIGKNLSHVGFLLTITDTTTEIPANTELFRIADFGRININNITFIAGRAGQAINLYTDFDSTDNDICIVKTGQAISGVASLRGEFTRMHNLPT